MPHPSKITPTYAMAKNSYEINAFFTIPSIKDEALSRKSWGTSVSGIFHGFGNMVSSRRGFASCLMMKPYRAHQRLDCLAGKMSAPVRITDSRQTSPHVRFVPILLKKSN